MVDSRHEWRNCCGRRRRFLRSWNHVRGARVLLLQALILLLVCQDASGRPQAIYPSLSSPLMTLNALSIRGGSSLGSTSRPAYTLANKIHQQVSSPSSQRQDERTATKEAMDAFLTRDSRQTFIARVYAILSAQLLVTASSIGMFARYPQIALSMVSSRPGTNVATSAIPMISLLISTICWITICVSPEARRSSPMKWQLLTVFTIGEAIAVGFITSFYSPKSVLSATLATATAVAGISFYTAANRDSKRDLSTWGAGLSSAGLIFCVYGLLTLFQSVGWLPAGFLPYNEMLYSFFGASLFSGYLAYHTRLIVSGKHTKYQMNEKDFVFGAMSLYNDIISMFIYILRLVGEDRDGSSSSGSSSRRRR